MQKKADIIFHDNQFHLSGTLDFSNVQLLYGKSLPQLRACSELNFNFSQLLSSNSSGLALIIEWIKFAKQQQKPIRFLHLSKELISIAKAAGIEALIFDQQ